ncbi:MAG: hypothetical protein HY033_08650 [Ignavibacteriae bacterium]|nr:hypothetical protein [Ignavibacteria bacterium]MBI3364962.1 hypothetical protein [Ignavibacteriota bacterium]
MTCNLPLKRIAEYLVLGLCAVFSITCNESLPTYVFPQNVLAMNVTLVEQLSNRLARPGHQMVHLVLTGKNIFDEVFYDSASIKGTVRIWWRRKPSQYTTLYLTKKNLTNPSLIQNGKILLLPEQQFSMSVYWNVKSHDSLYLPDLMDFTYASNRRGCDYNVICADPEEFVIEVSLQIYDKIGYVSAPAREFIFVATSCKNCGAGPYCPPPPNGCG